MAETYSALARRYRPRTFQEIIGQEHIARALRNAIRAGRVAHGYIFTGARGVGKTSTARIFAKALNCPNAVDGVPCNECEICEAISVGGDVDVLEIDGASNRTLDEARQLRSNVGIRPMRAANKIYIIDEAHQLTKDAWNALLKTLEEPPPGVKFIFCTTEPNKLLDTVKSRCQRFDFSTVETTSIVERLRQIAEAEGFAIETAALELVARRAGGSMRDSQSLLDQLLAFGADPITPADVHQLLGTADEERLVAIAAAVADGEAGRALAELDQTLAEGVLIAELFDQLIQYFRDLMVLAAGAGEVPLLSVSEQRRATLAEQAERLRLNTVLAATQILAEAAGRMKDASLARPIGDLALARIALLGDLDELAGLIAAVRSGGTSAAPGRSPGRRSSNRSEPPTQKKTPDDGSVLSSEPPERVHSVPFQPGHEDAILSQVLSRAGDSVKPHLVGISRVAISGPDALELNVPKQYSAAREYFCSSDGRATLETLLVEVVGRPIQISVLPISAPDRPEVASRAESAPAEERADRPSEVKVSGNVVSRNSRMRSDARIVTAETVVDPFVKKVMTVFEANEARVKILPSSTEV